MYIGYIYKYIISLENKHTTKYMFSDNAIVVYGEHLFATGYTP